MVEKAEQLSIYSGKWDNNLINNLICLSYQKQFDKS